jgi:hypothetical protein
MKFKGRLLLSGGNPLEPKVSGIRQGDRDGAVFADASPKNSADLQMQPDLRTSVLPGEGHFVRTHFPGAFAVALEFKLDGLTPTAGVDSPVLSCRIPTGLAGEGKEEQQQKQGYVPVAHGYSSLMFM